VRNEGTPQTLVITALEREVAMTLPKPQQKEKNILQKLKKERKGINI
jgi:hypothetical protein